MCLFVLQVSGVRRKRKMVEKMIVDTVSKGEVGGKRKKGEVMVVVKIIIVTVMIFAAG